MSMSDVADAVVVRLNVSLSRVRANALGAVGKHQPAALAYADAIVTKLEEIAELALDPPCTRSRACEELRKLEPRMLARRADGVIIRPDDSSSTVRRETLETPRQPEPPTLAQQAGAVVARLEDSDRELRKESLATLGKLEPRTLAQYAGALVPRLTDAESVVRREALDTLGKLKPRRLALYAHAVVARLEDSDEQVRGTALQTLGKLAPATLALHAHAVVERVEDSDWRVRKMAFETLGKLDPAALLSDSNNWKVRLWALITLGKLEPAKLAQHADAVVAMLEDSDWRANAVVAMTEDDSVIVRTAALAVRNMIPRHVTRNIDVRSASDCDLNHCDDDARDVEAWDRMNENQDQSASKRPSTRKRQKKATGAQAVGGSR